ncbi:hypothetical protein HYV72_00505 [Candidatus Uhrbacteria bacterium]|nr:hypothetical protein [Candidatus Uhrbacteria bacterium]
MDTGMKTARDIRDHFLSDAISFRRVVRDVALLNDLAETEEEAVFFECAYRCGLCDGLSARHGVRADHAANAYYFSCTTLQQLLTQLFCSLDTTGRAWLMRLGTADAPLGIDLGDAKTFWYSACVGAMGVARMALALQAGGLTVVLPHIDDDMLHNTDLIAEGDTLCLCVQVKARHTSSEIHFEVLTRQPVSLGKEQRMFWIGANKVAARYGGDWSYLFAKIGLTANGRGPAIPLWERDDPRILNTLMKRS